LFFAVRYWRDCHCPSGNSSRRAPKLRLGAIDEGRADAVDRGKAVFVDQGEHALARNIVAGNHRAQVERDHLRATDHVEDGLPDVWRSFPRETS